MVKVGDRIVIPGVGPQAAAKPPAKLAEAPKPARRAAQKVATVPAAPAATPTAAVDHAGGE